MNTTDTAIIENPYKTPDARVADAEERLSPTLFYVVAPRKFLLLMIGTFGLYSIYWFYENWALLNRKHKAYWPVARGIFSIFFAHSLFAEVDRVIRGSDPPRKFSWSPSTLATIYVVSSLISNICDRLSMKDIGSPVTDLLPLAMLVPTVLVLYRAQHAINFAEGDPDGARNRTLTAANIFWLVLGAVWWLLILVGTYITLFDPDIQ